ncbi:MAG TPA: endonuclease MutS2 [Blastocatellia bacterium]|nr:endonuclease MutS2 [Blastocatellia bacterium]
MRRQAFDTLEFDKLKESLLRLARTPLGAARVAELTTSDDVETITRELKRTSEGVEYLREGTAFDFSDLPDPTPALAKLNVADINLEPREILDLMRLMSVAAGLRETFRDEAARFPLLREITRDIANLRSLEQRLRSRILPDGEIDDFASPELREARYQLSQVRNRIQRSLERILKQAEADHALRDDFITIRNERYVIPIRNDNRGAVAGVVHGMSSSGQTAFIEPLETIELNNELVRLREIEQAEITKVLFAITEELREERESLGQMAEATGLIDFIAAKARLAIQHNAIEPGINEAGRMVLKDARHPLLEANLAAQNLKIVPISFELDADYRVMVISGPNAGGKTVVLKTAGLLALMAQAGLHVPATNADLPIFHQVLADIGDHQSIAANLSTFTAHLENIRDISNTLEPPAIILLDEVGTGTDPEEGSALGVAMVDYFRERGAHVMVTTHYSGLKMYATNSPGVINASVEFDERTLKPTYRLLTGLAGSSSGIEIARRFGMPAAITDRAAGQVKGSTNEATEYLRRLKEQRDEQQQIIAALEEERAAVAKKYAELEKDFQQREREREKEFRASLQKVVDEFVARAEKFAAGIENAPDARKARKEAERRAAELRSSATSALFEMKRHAPGGAQEYGESAAAEEAAPAEVRDFQVGDHVRVLSLDKEGVIESISGDEIGVQVGSLRFRERAENLRLLQPRAASGKSARAANVMPKGVTVSLREQPEVLGSELNVIGKTAVEAADETDKFLDAAYLSNYDRVRIIHGMGMGALRKAVATLLTGHPHVAKFYPAAANEGGNGATIVELKK